MLRALRGKVREFSNAPACRVEFVSLEFRDRRLSKCSCSPGIGQGNPFTMVNRNLLRQFDLSEDELNEAFAEPNWLPEQEQEYEVNKIVTGKVLQIVGDE